MVYLWPKSMKRLWAGRLCKWLGLALALLLWLVPCPAMAAPAATWPGNIKIFDTMDFKSPIKGLPQWERVMRRGDKDMEILSTCTPGERGCPAAAARWQKLMLELKGKPAMEQMQAVTKFFNAWPYRLDKDNYGMNDYWAAPLEFIKNSGDCEDYSIIKYYALKRLGFDSQNMRIVALMDKILNLGHAVLTVYVNGEVYVLDNQTNGVFPTSRFKHYAPQYSVNEFFKWAHIPSGK